MADAGPFTVLLGDNVLSRNNLLPRWERSQNSFATLYIVFILLFGVISPMTLPYCIQAAEGAKSFDMNDAEAEFFAHYCRYQRSIGADPVTLRFLIVCFVFLAVIASNTILESTKRSSSVIIYASSEKTILKLNLPLQDLQKMAVSPILGRQNRNSPEMKIRKVIENMIKYDAGDVTIVLILRGVYTLIILAIGFYYTIKLYVTILHKGNGPYLYGCAVKNDIGAYTNFSRFICSESWSRFDFMIVVLYQIVLLMHCVACSIGLIKIIQIRHRVSTLTTSLNLSNASHSMLHLAEMSRDSRDKESIFHEFVHFIFNRETPKIMERYIPNACGFREKDTDEGYLAIFASMTGKNATYDKWLSDFADARNWKSIVMLLNALPTHFHDLSFINDVIEILDSDRNNILYYALHKEPGFSKFKTEAVECIFKEIGEEVRVVLHDERRSPASDFVQTQYDSDPTYPEQLRDELLNLCKKDPCSMSLSKV